MTTPDLDLDQATALILRQSQATPSHSHPLLTSCGRLCAHPLEASMAIPHFRQSAMDGFAMRRSEVQEGVALPICGEIAAGTTTLPTRKQDCVIRIMTGGMVPDWCDLVVPFENCQEHSRSLTVERIPRRSHIREIGTDVNKGQVIIAAGEVITPGHMHLAATAGAAAVQIHRRPRIAILCTGSELVERNPLPGQLVSGNLFLLTGLISQAGGKVVTAVTVADDEHTMSNILAELPEVDMVITTGGMGPGKYDLVSQVLHKAGVTILYRQLQLRPGKSTLFGVDKQTLFFGLPGPPPAVRVLFHELVRPAILAQQNAMAPRPAALQAQLTANLAIRQKGILNLKGGILTLHKGKALVRPAGRHEAASCIILVPAHRRCLKKGELATIHLTES